MKKLFILLVCLSLLLLQGCFPSGKKENPTDDFKNNSTDIVISGSDDPESIPGYVDLELEENLIVKADVNAPDNLKLKNVSVSLKRFDFDKVVNTLINGKTISQTHEWDSPLFRQYKEKSYECEDRSNLVISLGGIRYFTAYYSDRDYSSVIFGSNYFIRPEIKDIYKQNELEQVNKDTAISTVKQVITSLGITVSDTPDVVALDFETLKSEWEDYETPKGNGPHQWEKSDEAYVVIYHVLYESVQITNTGYMSTNGAGAVTGSRIIGVVTKDGLIYFQCNGIYEVGNIIKDSITPISLSLALEQIKAKYKNVLLTDPVIISHIALEYVPQATNSDSVNYELIPAWVFTTSQKTTKQDAKGTYEVTSYFPIILYAESGQELRIGGLA